MRRQPWTVALLLIGCARPSLALNLIRVAPDRVEPRQRALSVGFYGGSADLVVDGPDYDEFRKGGDVHLGRTYPQTVIFNNVLVDSPNDLRRSRSEERGFLRMEPKIWYGVRRSFPGKMVADGRVSMTGRFHWLRPQTASAPDGWHVVSRTRSKRRLTVRSEGRGISGGGIGFTLEEPKGWRLRDIEVTPGARYVASFASAWDDPLSTWKDPKPGPYSNRDGRAQAFSFTPAVWAEFETATLRNDVTGERKTVETPTGWIVVAGDFGKGGAP